MLCQAAPAALEGSKQPVLLPQEIASSSGFPGGRAVVWLPTPQTLCSHLPPLDQTLSTSLPGTPHPRLQAVGPSCSPLHDIFDLAPRLLQAGPMLTPVFSRICTWA